MAGGLRLGSLYVSLSAQTTGFAKGMAGALKDLERFSNQAKKVSGEVAMFSGAMAGLGIAAVKLASSVDGPTKQAMTGLENSTKLLAVQVADMLLPAVRQLTAMFREAAAVVAGLDPELKKQISSWAVMAVQVAAAAKALSMFSGLAANVFGVLKGGFGMLASVGTGPMLSIAIGVGLVIGAVLLLHRAWRKNWGGIQEATQSVLSWLQKGFSGFANFMGSVWDFVIDGAANFVSALLDVGAKLEQLTGKDLGVSGMREGFAGLWKDLKSGSFFSEAFQFGKSVGAQLVDGIIEEAKLVGKEVSAALGLGGASKKKPIGPGRGMGGGGGGPAVSGAVGQQFGGINAGAGWLHEMEKLEAATQKHAADLDNARGAELRNRLAIASDLEKQKRVAGAIRSGSVSSLTGGARADAEKQMAGTVDSAVNASSWGSAMDTLEAGLQGSANAGTTLEVWGKRMSGIFARAGQDIFGAVGSMVGSIVEGAVQGGVWGAIIAAIMEVVKTSASAMEFLGTAMNFVKMLGAMIEPLVKPIFDALTDVLGIVSIIIVPIFKALGGLFKIIGDIVGYLTPILVAIGDLFEAIGPILEVIFKVVGGILEILKPIFALIGGVIKVIASVILGFIIFLNEIAAAFGDTKARAEADRMKAIIDKMWSPNHEAEVAAAGKAAGATLRNAEAQDKAADAAQRVSESLTNLPAGFNIANARYQSDMGITSASAFSGSRGGGGNVTINGDVNVTSSATSIPAITQDAKNAKKEAARERGQRDGNPEPPERGGRG